MPSTNTILLILIIIIIGATLWAKVRRNRRQINVIAYAALVIWDLSLLIAFILELYKS